MSDTAFHTYPVSEEVLADLIARGEESEAGLITIRDPEVLKKYGWKACTPAMMKKYGLKDPFPSYVTAAPSLWSFWLDQTTRSK
jgi:hypothetical protein